VTDNKSLGVAIFRNPLMSQDPDPNGDEVRRNLVVGNGLHASSGLPGVDLFYDTSGSGNCFARNKFGTSVPPNIETAFPCH
jgi:hypothetical protein